jgi:hypothetical protein
VPFSQGLPDGAVRDRIAGTRNPIIPLGKPAVMSSPPTVSTGTTATLSKHVIGPTRASAAATASRGISAASASSRFHQWSASHPFATRCAWNS